MKSNTGLLLSVLILTSINLKSQNLQLNEAVELGLENNFSIKIAENNAEIAENNNSAGNAGFLPTIAATGIYSESTNDTEQIFFDGNSREASGAKSDNLSAAVELNWTLFDGFRMFASRERLTALEELGEVQVGIIIEAVLSDIINQYYLIVQEENLLAVYAEAIELSKERQKMADARMELGAGSLLDQLQTQTALNTDSAAWLQQQNVLEQQKIILNRLLGRAPATSLEVSDTIIIDVEIPDFASLNELASSQNKQLREARIGIGINQAEIEENRAAYFPELSVFAVYGYNRAVNEVGLLQLNRNQGFEYGLALNFNLFNGFNDRRNLMNSRLALENANQNLLDAQLAIEGQLYGVYADYTTARKLLKLEERNLNSARQNLDIAIEQYELGAVDEITFRQIQLNAIQAESRLLSAQFQVKQAETELYRLSGQLNKAFEE